MRRNALKQAMPPTPLLDFRRQAASALMHPATLAALGVLLLNDHLLKHVWPGEWIPGKLSDLAWMTFAPPALALILSFAARTARRHQAAFAAAYAGLPLLYAAFNTFQPVHDGILRALGVIGGDGPRSPLDPTDSLVIPVAMAAALWVWRRPALPAQSIRARLALLAVGVAALASVASSYAADYGIEGVGRTSSGTLGALSSPTYLHADGGYTGYESLDGGLTWTERRIEGLEWIEVVGEPSGATYTVDDPHIVREQGGRPREEMYSYAYLRNGGNRWMQALDKKDIEHRVIATEPRNLFYDDLSGNLIAAMGLQGVVVIAPDGTATRVAVGPHSPTDFSFGNKLRTYLGSLLLRETALHTGAALLLVFSLATLALAESGASSRPRTAFALGAAVVTPLLALGTAGAVIDFEFSDSLAFLVVPAFVNISSFLAISCIFIRNPYGDKTALLAYMAAGASVLFALVLGIYPHVNEHPRETNVLSLAYLALYFSGYGAIPLGMAAVALALVGPTRRQALAFAAAMAAMLLLIGLGALALFEWGPRIASFIAIGLVGAATFGFWTYLKRMNR